jgi:hypothetical protein
MNLVNNLLRVQFRTLNYSDKEVNLKGDRVVVRNAGAYPRFYWIKGQGVLGSDPGKWDYRLLEEFANCDGTPEAILRFTEQYGPLNARLRTGERRQTTFRIADWKTFQNEYRKTWEELRPKGTRALFPHASLKTLPGERFFWWFSELSYQTADLYRLLLLELHSVPRHRLRKCRRQGCTTPFFIAQHLSRRYCTACRRAARLESKRKSWQNHKQRWRSGG